jgi:hypothetical protein
MSWDEKCRHYGFDPNGHMQPEVEHGTFAYVEGPNGNEWVPSEVLDNEAFDQLIAAVQEGDRVALPDAIGDYFQNDEASDAGWEKGYGYRLSAPGYMDSTEWGLEPTEQEAWETLSSNYGDFDQFDDEDGTSGQDRETYSDTQDRDSYVPDEEDAEESTQLNTDGKFKVEVIADDSGEWTSNALTFETVEDAEEYAKDLFSRWSAVREYRVVPVECHLTGHWFHTRGAAVEHFKTTEGQALWENPDPDAAMRWCVGDVEYVQDLCGDGMTPEESTAAVLRAFGDGVEEKRELSVPEKHQKKIALQTLKYSDAGAHIMGGMTKDEARKFLKSIGYTDEQIAKLEEAEDVSEAPVSADDGYADGGEPYTDDELDQIDNDELKDAVADLIATAESLLAHSDSSDEEKANREKVIARAKEAIGYDEYTDGDGDPTFPPADPDNINPAIQDLLDEPDDEN